MQLLQKIQLFDIRGLELINTERNQEFDLFFQVITDSAPVIAFCLPLVFIVWHICKKNTIERLQWFIALISVSFAALFSTILKYLINRPRPFEIYDFVEKLSGGGNPSFPSGHTTDAFALAIVLLLIKPRWYVWIPAFIWAILTAWSRIHLGVHYPSDVLAGAIIGTVTAAGCYLIAMKLLIKK